MQVGGGAQQFERRGIRTFPAIHAARLFSKQLAQLSDRRIIPQHTGNDGIPGRVDSDQPAYRLVSFRESENVEDVIGPS